MAEASSAAVAASMLFSLLSLPPARGAAEGAREMSAQLLRGAAPLLAGAGAGASFLAAVECWRKRKRRERKGKKEA